MPVPGIAQPVAPPFMTFRLDDVTAQELGVPAGPVLPPSSVITAGNNFTLQLNLGLDGLLAGLLAGQQFNVFHHAQRLEDGVLVGLPGGISAVPATVPGDFVVNTGPFTTGPTGQLQIAPGFASGTFRILTHIHFVNPPARPLVTAFHEIILMVT